MKPFRRLVIALLVLALPVQGALASSRWLCAATATPSASHAGGHVHGASPDGNAPSHAAVMHAHAHGSHGMDAAHGTPPADPSVASHDASHAGGAPAGCSLCAACMVTPATPPAVSVVAAVEATDDRFLALDVSVPHFGTGGPERPPRTL